MGEQTTESRKPFRQATHSKGVDRAMSDVKLHKLLEKEDAFILSYFNWKGCLLWGLNVNAFLVLANLWVVCLKGKWKMRLQAKCEAM